MKNRPKWRGLRSQDVQVYRCRVLVEYENPVERVISGVKALEIHRENKHRAKEIVRSQKQAEEAIGTTRKEPSKKRRRDQSKGASTTKGRLLRLGCGSLRNHSRPGRS